MGSFFDAVGDFVSNLASVHWGAMLAGLAAFGSYLTLRSRAYFHGYLARVLRARIPAGQAGEESQPRLFIDQAMAIHIMGEVLEALRGQAPVARIHGTPGYPVTVTVGMTFRLFGK